MAVEVELTLKKSRLRLTEIITALSEEDDEAPTDRSTSQRKLDAGAETV